ncbi:MAG: 4Fe-4S binding protein [Planctomycetota bacterium]|jgi:spermidine synthase
MRLARGLLLFAYGLFTIAAQTLLFREFITTFEGNDISVGVFFGTWFLWVGLGAVIVYKIKTIADKLLGNVELLFLAYLPAFVLQLVLIVQARELAGVEAYELLPIRTILLLSVVLNAPLSIITGMLFPVACRWVERDTKLAVSRVYILEAVGSFVGGLGVTILLAFGMSAAKVALILGVILSASVFVVQLTRLFSTKAVASYRVITCLLSFSIPLAGLICILLAVDQTLMHGMRAMKWTKLLDADALEGSFQTPQAEYLYGTYQGQWIVVREASVCEALPDESSAGRIAAVGLCQNPKGRKVLVIGSGLALCRQLLLLPQIEHITWTHPDGQYVQRINSFVPDRLRIDDERLSLLAGDIRPHLIEKQSFYDLAIINLPEATSSVLNRYYTLEFYRRIKESLSPGGILAVSVAGGENIMGTELVNLGASVKLTLDRVFSRLALTPGEQTWFIASDSQELTGNPGTLRDRFAQVESGTEVFPPDGLLSVYLPDRAAAALEAYATADLPENLLVNRDTRPLTHLYSLLLAAKQSGAAVTRLVKYVAVAGPLAFIAPILVLVVLRVAYILKTAGQGKPSSFDTTFLIFSAGSLGIGVVIVLMYLYQTRFGSLYLHIGLISSVFMVGLTAGAVFLTSLLTSGSKTRPHVLLFAVIFVHILILVAVAFWPAEQYTHLAFAAAFILCGLCSGGYFPIAARQLADSAFEAGQVGSKLETADHLGAAIGGVLTSLALVPLLGAKVTLFLFVLLIGANVPLAVMLVHKPERIASLRPTTFSWRPIGYALFGVAASVVLCSNLLAAAAERLSPTLPQYAAQALAGQVRLERASAAVGDRNISYFDIYDANENPLGHIFSSQDLAPEVRGFGGRINLGIYLDTTGVLVDFHIIRSNETPAYLDLLGEWPKRLKGRRLFGPQPLADVHTVTGATVTCKAILAALQTSAHSFATEILGRSLEAEIEQRAPQAGYLPDRPALYLIAAFLLTLIVIYWGGFWSRLAVLCFNLVAGGIILNAQYSTEQIVTTLSFHAPTLALSGTSLLVVAVPLLVFVFGNIYCGYICPFGALQELLGYVIPRRFKQPIGRPTMQKARFIKYVLLFVLISAFFFSRNRTTLAADPLISIFNLRFTIYDLQFSLLVIAATGLFASIFYTRFWCRYLCPAGAFLSLFNNVAILKRFLPAKKFGRCEFGLTGKDQMDCIYCDKCRYDPTAATAQKPAAAPHYALAKLLSHCLIPIVLVFAVLATAVSGDRFVQVLPSGLEHPTTAAASGGEPRDVDLKRIGTMIEQGKLSDKEAQFYKQLE